MRQHQFLFLPAVLVFSATSAAAMAADASPYGMCVGLNEYQDHFFNELESLGTGWMRWSIYWSGTETSQDTFNFGWPDYVIPTVAGRGISLYVDLQNTPAWATNGPAGTGVPRNSADWYDFCYRMAQRYPQVKYWGMWNEPNYSKFWAGSVADYVNVILIPGAQAVRAANPNAKICAADTSDLHSPIDDAYFMGYVLDNARSYVDVITHHIYDDNTTDLRNELQNTIKPVLDSRGWTGPFWLTETGWKTDSVGTQGQADRFNSFLNTWMTRTPPYDWMDKVFFFLLNEGVGGDNTYGILDYNAGYNPPYTRKPAYNTYQSFILVHQDYSQFVSSTIPAWMLPGQTVSVKVKFQNTGYTTWTAAGNYRLGGVGDSDPFAPARQNLAPGDGIAPGQNKAFTFNMTAPTTPGTYLTDWQMLVEGVAWFGDVYSRTVVVSGPRTYSDTFTNNSGTLNGRSIESGGVTWAGSAMQVAGGKAKPTGGTARILAGIPINSANAGTVSVKADMRDNVSGSMFLGLPGAALGNMDQTNASLYLEVARNGDYNVRSVTGGVITTHFAGGTIPGWVINSTHAFELIYHVAAKTVDIKMDNAALVSGVSVGSSAPLLQYAGFQAKRFYDTQTFAVADADFDNFTATVQP